MKPQSLHFEICSLGNMSSAWLYLSAIYNLIGSFVLHSKNNIKVQSKTYSITQGLLSILTPVFPDEKTLNLLRNQLRTFSHFFAPHGVVEWVFVSPAASLGNLTRYLDKELQLLHISKSLVNIIFIINTMKLCYKVAYVYACSKHRYNIHRTTT